MENLNMVPDMDQAYEDSFYKIIELLDTKSTSMPEMNSLRIMKSR